MSFEKKFETILATNDFAQLVPFTKPASWKRLSQDERELLAILFLKQAEDQLAKEDNKFLESLELATKIAPECAAVFFKQAHLLSTQDQNIHCLKAAAEALQKTTELDPSIHAAWLGWGNILAQIGFINHDVDYFYLADEKFRQVEQLSQKDIPNLLPENFYWHWGMCWYRLGRMSEEAVDYLNSLEKFRIAAAQAPTCGEFYNDFGNVLVEIAFLLGREELFTEAAEQYKIAVSRLPKQYEGWINLAYTYRRLYSINPTEEFFRESDVCFEHGIDIDPNDFKSWLHWAELYVHSGRMLHEFDRIQMSYSKFQKADSLDPRNAFILSRWGEALMIGASYMEDLDLLRDAESKLQQSIKLSPEDSTIWYLYGSCLYELGKYFVDLDYFKRAINKFQHGLSFNNKHVMLHHGIAMAQFAIGDLTSDPKMIEQAILNCSRVVDLEPNPPHSFWNDYGVALMKLGEITNEQKHVEAAAEKFERAISNHIDDENSSVVDLEWLYNYGCAMDFLGDFHEEPVYYERAVQVLSHVLHLEPAFTHARYNLALALSHLGELNSDIDSFHKAIDLFNTLIHYDGEDELAWNDLGLTLLNLAVLTADIGQPEQSQKIYDDAESKFLHAIALGNTNSFYNLASLYSLTNQINAAMHYLERAKLSDALPPVEDIIHDEWLENLRHLPAFRTFISQLLSK